MITASTINRCQSNKVNGKKIFLLTLTIYLNTDFLDSLCIRALIFMLDRFRQLILNMSIRPYTDIQVPEIDPAVRVVGLK